MSGTESPVIVGVDGTYTASLAAQWAAAVAGNLAAPLSIVHAHPPLGHSISDAAAALLAEELTQRRQSSHTILQATEYAVRADFPDLQVTTTETWPDHRGAQRPERRCPADRARLR